MKTNKKEKSSVSALGNILEPKKLELTPMKILSIVLIIGFVYLSTIIVTNSFTIKKYSKEKLRVEEELVATEKEIKELETFIKNAKNPDFVEKMARENLKMVKPDEKVYIVVK